MSEKIEIYWRLVKEKVHKLIAHYQQYPVCFFATIMVVSVVIIVGFTIFTPTDSSQSNEDTEKPPRNIQIFVWNECNYEIHVKVWVTDVTFGEEVYYGDLYIGTGFFSDYGTIQTDIPVGSLIKIRVRSTSYPWHNAITPQFESPYNPDVILHQDGSVTYSR